MDPDPVIAAIENLPPLREVIAQHGLRAEKSLGQNFLLDQNITDKIVRHVALSEDLNVFEIGPGPGGLTRSLLKGGAKSVIAVEYDERAVTALSDLENAADGRLKIVQQDALSFDLREEAPVPRAIVANLPYNIATPLLLGWLEHIAQDHTAYKSMTLMFQKEVAERIVARANTKAYGRLSVMSQWLCDVKILFDLPASAFTPAPKVKSSIVQFKPKDHVEPQPPFKVMEKILAEAFGQRRKMLRSSLKSYRDVIAKAGIDEQLRAENLSVEEFIALSKIM